MILMLRSLALASLSATIFLSSWVVWLSVVMVFLILSGDWTMREFVLDIASCRLSSSPFNASWEYVNTVSGEDEDGMTARDA